MTTTEKMYAEIEGWKKHELSTGANFFTEKFVNHRNIEMIAVVVDEKQILSVRTSDSNEDIIDTCKSDGTWKSVIAIEIAHAIISRK